MVKEDKLNDAVKEATRQIWEDNLQVPSLNQYHEEKNWDTLFNYLVFFRAAPMAIWRFPS